MMQDEAMWTSKEVIAYLQISRETLLRMRKRGELVGHKVGYTWRFHPDDVRGLVGREMPPSNENPAA